VIYLDHHAATPLVAGARAAMAEILEDSFANPSSVHAPGRRARALLEEARSGVASALGVAPADLVLTGGGTEACNLAVLGSKASRFVTTEVEHPAVSESIAIRERDGAAVIRLRVPRGRPPTAEELAAVLERDTWVAIQWINHETGTLFPIADYARACEAAGARLFVDGTQAVGKVPVELRGIDLFAVSSSKIGGPSGAGALYVRRGIDLDSRVVGGAQERGRRAGSPALIAQVGFGAAARAVPDRLGAMPRVASLRDRLERGLVDRGAVVNGGEGPRAPTATNVSFEGRRSDLLIAALDLEGIAASRGAACSSGLDSPSAVVLAMHPERWRAECALRMSLGPETTRDEIDGALAAVTRVLDRRS
jgi:cysteine desulfurase